MSGSLEVYDGGAKVLVCETHISLVFLGFFFKIVSFS